MEAIYNSETKLIIAALPRSGSQHLRRIARQLKFKEYYYFNPTFIDRFDCTGYKLVQVVRDPYYRWRSWFYDFVWDQPTLNLKIDKWTVDDARNWMKKFEIVRHYNPHTGLQQVLYDVNFEGKKFDHTEYIMMNDIDYYLNLAPGTRINYDQHIEKESTVDLEVVTYMRYKIIELYQEDYDWLKTLKIWNNGVDTLSTRC